jgi:transposase
LIALGFHSEYKDEAVELVVATGRAVATVARQLGIKETMLGRWVMPFNARTETGQTAVTASGRAEFLRYGKKTRIANGQGVLEKASIFFAQEASDTNVLRST